MRTCWLGMTLTVNEIYKGLPCQLMWPMCSPTAMIVTHIYMQPQREETSLWVAVPCAQFPLLLWSLPFKQGIYFRMWLSCLRLSAEGLLRAVCCASLWLAPMSPSGTQPSLPEGPPGAISSVSQTSLGWHHQLLKSEMHFARKSEILIFPSNVSFSEQFGPPQTLPAGGALFMQPLLTQWDESTTFAMIVQRQQWVKPLVPEHKSSQWPQTTSSFCILHCHTLAVRGQKNASFTQECPWQSRKINTNAIKAETRAYAFLTFFRTEWNHV